MRGRGNGPALAQGQHTLAKVGSTHYPGSPGIIRRCIKLPSVHIPVPGTDIENSSIATLCAVFKGITLHARS